MFSLIYRFGLAVSKNPWLTILLSVTLCIISTTGNFFWNENTNDAELWTPYGSPVCIVRSSFFLAKSSTWSKSWISGFEHNTISSNSITLRFMLIYVRFVTKHKKCNCILYVLSEWTGFSKMGFWVLQVMDRTQGFSSIFATFLMIFHKKKPPKMLILGCM